MKKLKLSKIAWIVLSVGIFIVVLAGLGLTYAGQKKEQNTLSGELELAKTRLEKTQDTVVQQQQISQLEERLSDSQSRLAEARGKLLQAILSVDVIEKFYQIAESSGVTITNIGTTNVQKSTFSGVDCYKIGIHATVTGDELKLIDFIINVNQNFITGNVISAQIQIAQEAGDSSSASVQAEVFSSKGI